MADEQDFDLDEDLFGFEVPEESITDELADEEDLEALFAAFQNQEEEEETAAEPASTDAQSAALDEFMAAGNSESSGTGSSDAGSVAGAGSSGATQGQAALAGGGVRIVAGSSLLSKSSLLILISVTALNGLVALVTLRNTGEMRDSVLRAQRDIANTAVEIVDYSGEREDRLADATTPLVPPDPDQHPTFARARKHIAEGDYAMARQRIYALLSVVDGLDEEHRAKIESRAQYLLANATHLEALERMEADQ